MTYTCVGLKKTTSLCFVTLGTSYRKPAGSRGFHGEDLPLVDGVGNQVKTEMRKSLGELPGHIFAFGNHMVGATKHPSLGMLAQSCLGKPGWWQFLVDQKITSLDRKDKGAVTGWVG